MSAYLVYQCPEASPSLRGKLDDEVILSSKGPHSDAYMAPVCPLSSKRISLSFSHSHLSLLLHLAVAHLGRIIKSKVIRFFTLAQYTFFQTIIPVSVSRLNQFPPSPPGCGPQISWYSSLLLSKLPLM